MKNFQKNIKLFFDLANPTSLKLYPKNYNSKKRPIFIGGCGRSGTTLLRILMSKHEDVFSGPEFNIHSNQIIKLRRRKYSHLPQRAYMLKDPNQLKTLSRKFEINMTTINKIINESLNFPDFMENFFSYLTKKNNKKFWIEKTPKNCNIIEYIYKYFPNSKFIHIIRDGRDVVCSLRNHPNSYVDDNGNIQKIETNNPIKKCINRWVFDVENALRFRDDKRYYELKYEHLLENKEKEIKKIFNFIGIMDDGKINFEKEEKKFCSDAYFLPSVKAKSKIDKKRIGRWKKDLSKNEAFIVQEIAGDLLNNLGYIKNKNWLNFFK